jgi:hypothetical protein
MEEGPTSTWAGLKRLGTGLICYKMKDHERLEEEDAENQDALDEKEDVSEELTSEELEKKQAGQYARTMEIHINISGRGLEEIEKLSQFVFVTRCSDDVEFKTAVQPLYLTGLVPRDRVNFLKQWCETNDIHFIVQNVLTLEVLVQDIDDTSVYMTPEGVKRGISQCPDYIKRRYGHLFIRDLDPVVAFFMEDQNVYRRTLFGTLGSAFEEHEFNLAAKRIQYQQAQQVCMLQQQLPQQQVQQPLFSF